MASIARSQAMLRHALPAFSTSSKLVSSRAASTFSRPTSCILAATKSSPAPYLIRNVALRSAFPKATGIAGFQTSSRRDILPPLPQRINGTVNEAAAVPTPHPMHGSYEWVFERVIAVSLIPLTIAPFAGASLNPVMDATFVGLLIIHSHLGFKQCIVDYFPKQRVPKTRLGFEWLLRIATLAAAVGFYEFETNDVGITEAVKRLYTA